SPGIWKGVEVGKRIDRLIGIEARPLTGGERRSDALPEHLDCAAAVVEIVSGVARAIQLHTVHWIALEQTRDQRGDECWRLVRQRREIETIDAVRAGPAGKPAKVLRAAGIDRQQFGREGPGDHQPLWMLIDDVIP